MPTRGKVKWFDPKKGYGFILGPEDQDVFVHFSQIEGDGFRSLKDGEDVDYELIEGDKGWQAKTVLRALIQNEEIVGNTDGDNTSGENTDGADTSGVIDTQLGDHTDALN